jgi:fatty acid desaturase
VGQAGLLERQPLYYVAQITATLGLLGASLLVLAFVDNAAIQVANAIFLAFVFTQIGFLGHDAGHRQIFRATRTNDWLGLLFGNLLLGLSHSWWVDKHNRHHGHPNHPVLDPDIEVPVLAFSREQALEKRGFARWVVKHQAYLFFPLLTLEGISLRNDSFRFLFEKRPRLALLEFALMIAHLVGYFALVFHFLPVGLAVTFVIVHQAAFGLYLGAVFAPNHKGMLITDDEMELDFLREQVLTSRNVRPNIVTDYLYGGLNYQIEHHLFPGLARKNLRQVQEITAQFCAARSITYHETGVLQSYREILESFRQVGAHVP